MYIQRKNLKKGPMLYLKIFKYTVKRNTKAKMLWCFYYNESVCDNVFFID